MGVLSNLIEDASVLKVLRLLEKGNYIPEYRKHNVIDSMPDYEFNVICKELRDGGYIFAVFDVLGNPEGAILLDKGKLLLKCTTEPTPLCTTIMIKQSPRFTQDCGECC